MAARKRKLLFEYWEIRWAGPVKEQVRVNLSVDAGEPLWIAGSHTMRNRKTALKYWKNCRFSNKYYRLIHVKRYKTIK